MKQQENRISLPNLSFDKFFEIFQSTLDFFASYKQKKNQVLITLLWQKD